MTKQKVFTKEFEEEAVRLALTSSRTRRELAENLGVGLSTLTRWISQHTARELDAVAHAINARARKTLGWKTPAEALDGFLAKVHTDGVATTA